MGKLCLLGGIKTSVGAFVNVTTRTMSGLSRLGD